jgi:hypothetical protein
MKNLLIILIALIFTACGGTETASTTDAGTPTTPVPAGTLVNPSGKAEAGPCYLLSGVSAMAMDINWIQSGYVVGEMQKNDGTYEVPGSYSSPFVVYDFDGTCYSEGDNVDVDGVQMKMGQPIAATSHNINHATTWRYHLAKRYFSDPTHPNYQDAAGAFVQAKTDIYNYLNFSGATKNFYELSIVGHTMGDAYLFAFEAAVTKSRNGPSQSNYIGEAVNAVINEDLVFRNNLRNTISLLPIKSIYDNLKNKLTSLGFAVDPAPIYDIDLYPDYYADLMGRTVTVLEWINQASSTTIAFDTTGFNSFAYPITFTSIESAAYIATELDGDLSIWSTGTCNQGTDYPCPLALILTTEQLRETILEPELLYNGSLGAHSLTNGTQYFIVQEFSDYTHKPVHAADGDMLPFGRNLASIDNNWGAAVGWDNTTTWFRRSPKTFITD